MHYDYLAWLPATPMIVKRSFFDSFFNRFQKRLFFSKNETIVFENDRFFKNDKRPFCIRLFFTKRPLTKSRR